jgi:hypothetical protein
MDSTWSVTNRAIAVVSLDALGASRQSPVSQTACTAALSQGFFLQPKESFLIDPTRVRESLGEYFQGLAVLFHTHGRLRVVLQTWGQRAR